MQKLCVCTLFLAVGYFLYILVTKKSPENIETCRIIAGKSLQAYLETFSQKTIIKMPLVLQFGFVNLLNACLVLLEDEDAEVRDIATHFANRLPRFEIIHISSCSVLNHYYI